MKKTLFLFFTFCFVARLFAADPFASERSRWMAVGEKLKPELNSREINPVRTVTPVKDATAFQGWRMTEKERIASPALDKKLVTGDSQIYDFGEHIVGYVTLSLSTKDKDAIDGPVQIELVLDEVPAGVIVPPSEYKGSLSRGWLQNERITVDQVPFTITLPRRYAFRYVRVNVIQGSGGFDLRLDKLQASAVSSAGKDLGQPCANTPMQAKIDSISLITLRDCMQTILEDGPKRDRRLWIGDLRLEALSNYVSFKNADIIKRSLYLLASVAREDGLLAATIFERPEVMRQENNCCMDYALLYNVALYEYLQHYGDTVTARDLLPVALRQTEIASKYIEDGIFTPENKDGWWRFFDWNEQLDKTLAMQGCVAYSFERTAQLAKALGKEKEARELMAQCKELRRAAQKNYYDKKKGFYINPATGQPSYASQVWMVLGGVVKGKEANRLLQRMAEDPGMIKPRSPYLYHYYLEALYQCGENDKVREVITDYWGEMIDKGADTFWEVWDPTDEKLSPYGDHIINSYCHAWSCTPVYFLRMME
ncbi:MAG: glycoside hydrolase [Bacteroidales bacterium]|nr:glycoside hydrolase [Bacteroidales bacterium]